MKDLIKKYRDLGISCKIIFTEKPSICTYSISRNCLVGENGVPSLELVGNSLTYDNNRLVSLQVHKTLDVKSINKSNGIVITQYDTPLFRFALIPNT